MTWDKIAPFDDKGMCQPGRQWHKAPDMHTRDVSEPLEGTLELVDTFCYESITYFKGTLFQNENEPTRVWITARNTLDIIHDERWFVKCIYARFEVIKQKNVCSIKIVKEDQ